MNSEVKIQALDSYGKRMVAKWDKALNSDGGIADQYTATQTAILLENYMNELNRDPQLILEDQVETGDFKGVNLALLGVIRRVVPTIIGTELVGMQAMPTPKSPIFYLAWVKAIESANDPKGQSSAGQEFWGYPGATGNMQQIDEFYSSQMIRYWNKWTDMATNFAAGGSGEDVVLEWFPVVNGTITVDAIDSDGEVIETIHIPGDYSSGTVTAVQVFKDATKVTSGSIFDITSASEYVTGTRTLTVTPEAAYTLTGVTLADIRVNWEYTQENNQNSPELGLTMTEENLRLIRRQLRGVFTLDAQQDAKAYWGIDLDTELAEMMKIELMNEVNREIVGDLRTMAAISKIVDYSQYAANNVVGNYDDTAKLLLDVIAGVSSEIWNQGRLGYGNFIVGNPATMSIFARVGGFMGGGVKTDGKTLTFAGTLPSGVKMYYDPQYPKNEILVGYKGTSSTDTGYIYAPYSVVQATPTMYDFKTGSPHKIFFTRYGKTFERVNPTTGLSKNMIYRGQFNYARITLKNFPSLV